MIMLLLHLLLMNINDDNNEVVIRSVNICDNVVELMIK